MYTYMYIYIYIYTRNTYILLYLFHSIPIFPNECKINKYTTARKIASHGKAMVLEDVWASQVRKKWICFHEENHDLY